jgi:Streptomyces sporulation and cell division protein, SsgA
VSNDHDNRPLAADLSARLLHRGSKSVAARIHLKYRSTDPYAVEMTIRVRDQKPITWMFGRELLDDGLRQQSGLGNVTITPCPQAPTVLVHVKLRDDIGAADLEMRSEPVAEFLRLTYLQVPEGTEGLFVVIEDDVSAVAS